MELSTKKTYNEMVVFSSFEKIYLVLVHTLKGTDAKVRAFQGSKKGTPPRQFQTPSQN